MQTLTVFHDARCGLCAKFRHWLESQPKRVAVEFLPYDSPQAVTRFPVLAILGADRDVVVMADDGRWWQGTAAWLTCLWVTRDYRDWSFRLASPALRPVVKKAVHLLSENRLTLSRLLNLKDDRDLARALESATAPCCLDETCHL